MKRTNRAFTLVELLIASLILAAIFVPLYSAFYSGISGARDIDAENNLYQIAVQVLQGFDLELRNAFIYSANDAKFLGDKQNLSFLTLLDVFSRNVTLPQYSFVAYKAEGSKFTRLCRVNQDSLNAGSKTFPEEIPVILEELVFSYGYIDPADNTLKFKDTWGSGDIPAEKVKLPQAVKVKLVLKNKTTREFERTIFLHSS